jgi:hypothetical protein
MPPEMVSAIVAVALPPAASAGAVAPALTASDREASRPGHDPGRCYLARRRIMAVTGREMAANETGNGQIGQIGHTADST